MGDRKYKRVPITAAKDVAERYGKHEVVIVAVDRDCGRVHIATYGTTRKGCKSAESIGGRIAEMLGLTES